MVPAKPLTLVSVVHLVPIYDVTSISRMAADWVGAICSVMCNHAAAEAAQKNDEKPIVHVDFVAFASSFHRKY